MTDDAKTEIVEHAARAGRDQRWRRWTTVKLAVAGLLFAVLAVVAIYEIATTNSLGREVNILSGQQRDAAVAAQQLAGQLRTHGLTPVVTPPMPVVGPAGPTGPQGPGPSQQQIDDSVNRYFGQHPPGATPAMVAVQVAQFLTAHPPVTQDQIVAAASDFIAAHAAMFQGQPGATGQPGPSGIPGQPGANATDAQVAAAVTAFCDAHNSCAGSTGPPGAQGVQGISVTDLVFQRDQGGTCLVVITLHDPATNADTTITHPAGDAACPIVPPLHK